MQKAKIEEIISIVTIMGQNPHILDLLLQEVLFVTNPLV